MSLEFILFIIFALVAASTAVLLITRSSPIISALFLILNFAALAGLYILLNAQFIAVVQVIVYAGAIMVLFLFVIMLLKPGNEKLLEHEKGVKVLAMIVAIIVFAQLAYLIFFFKPIYNTIDTNVRINTGTVENIGRELYTNYVLPIQSAGFLLLAATIGAIVLAKKKFE